MNKKGGFFGKFLLLLIFLAILFEIILLTYAYVNADEVECNLFWCTFKTANTDIIQDVICKFNNQTVNCSDVDDSILDKIKEDWKIPE